MNHLNDDEQSHLHKDHELTLSTPAILGLFFGLVVLCGIFFGLGYMVRGGKSGPPIVADTAEPVPSNASFNNFKPAAGSPAAGSKSAATPAATSPPDTTPAEDTSTPAPHPPVAASDRPAPAALPTPAAPTGTLVVQVAAISITHPEDADLLINALRAKGYAISSHPEADKFIHIQVGPFATRHDAEAMRSRLQADGYSPYIK